MNVFLKIVARINLAMHAIAGIFLTFIMLLTTLDVVMRPFGMPIPGAVEIIAICCGIVIGFTVPTSFWMKDHISVDFVTSALPRKTRNLVDLATRCAAIVLSILISWNSMKIGFGFWKGGEVSGTLQLPLHPIAFALAACFFVLSVVFVCDIVRIVGGEHE
ncbi:MAG: TRAP transporter small permease [Desulfobacteraceae bacterium]|nr:MAG: TRAP transporter small permease [Desulfobacteraceae bacterium]